MNKQYLDAFSKVAPEKAKDLCGQARYLQAFGEAATGKAHSLLRQSRFISIGDTLSSLPSKPMTFKKACAALDTNYKTHCLGLMCGDIGGLCVTAVELSCPMRKGVPQGEMADIAEFLMATCYSEKFQDGVRCFILGALPSSKPRDTNITIYGEGSVVPLVGLMNRKFYVPLSEDSTGLDFLAEWASRKLPLSEAARIARLRLDYDGAIIAAMGNPDFKDEWDNPGIHLEEMLNSILGGDIEAVEYYHGISNECKNGLQCSRRPYTRLGPQITLKNLCQSIPKSQVRFNARIKDYGPFIKTTCCSLPVYVDPSYQVAKKEKSNRAQVNEDAVALAAAAVEAVACATPTAITGESEKVATPSGMPGSGKASSTPRPDNLYRTRTKIEEIFYANPNAFTYFVTLTLDPKKIDRNDPNAVTKALKTWLKNMSTRKGLIYLLVPEQHKDGAYHFHGFISGDLKLSESGKMRYGKKIYNLDDWTFGFSEVTELHGGSQSMSAERMAGYMRKRLNYVSKGNGATTITIPLGNRYYASQCLNRHVPTTVQNLDFEKFEAQRTSEIPLRDINLLFKYRTDRKQ